MDDGVLLLLLKERGPAGIPRASLDRPLVGALWEKAADLLGPGGFWSAGFAAHFLLWVALGLIACRLWRRLCPSLGAARRWSVHWPLRRFASGRSFRQSR